MTDARTAAVVSMILTFAAFGCSEREAVVFHPLPPGLEYPWRGEVESLPGVRTTQAYVAAHRALGRAVEDARRSLRRASSRSRGSRASAPAARSGPVDLNTATQSELESIPGVGPALAGRIIGARPFRRVEDLRRVRGIGRQSYGRIHVHACVRCEPAD
jgi:predicted flap endonuclease-1-like 5' DNA nuclease